MSVLDYTYNALVVVWSKYDTLPLVGFAFAFFINMLVNLGQRKIQLVESLLCGVIAAVLWISSEAIGIGEPWRILVSSAVGYHGTKASVGFIKSRLLGRYK